MRGLTIIVASPGNGLRTALELVSVQCALEGRARLFVHGVAVAQLMSPAPDDALYVEHGQGMRADALAIALDLGVEVIACQSGLALVGATLAACDLRIVAGGLVGLIATLGDDRLVTL